MDKPSVLFISSKWLDQDEELGISNAQHYLWETYPYESFLFHCDEYEKRNGKACDEALLEMVYEVKPDFVFLDYHIGGINPSLETLKKLGVPIVAIWWDHVWGLHIEEAELLQEVIDLNVVVDSSIFYSFVGKPNKYLYLWTPQHPDLYYPEEKSVPAGFYGRINKLNRPEIIEAIKKRFGDFVCDGGRKEQPLTKEKYAECYRKTGIVVNFSEGFSGFSQQVGRVMEATHSGCLLLEQANPETRAMFIPGKEYVEWTDTEDLLKKMEYYLSHREEREKIASCGHRKAKERYSAVRWWQIVLDGLEQRYQISMNAEEELVELLEDYNLTPQFDYIDPEEGKGPIIQGRLYILRRVWEDLEAGREVDFEAMGFKGVKGEVDPRSFLLELISLYLAIRDFHYATEYMVAYVEKDYEDAPSMRSFMRELADLLNRVKTTLARRKHRDFAMVVIDSLRHKDLEFMPTLRGLKEDSFVFEKAISPSLYTRPCFKGMFEGRLLDKHYRDHSFTCSLENSDFLRWMKGKFKVYNLSTFKFLPDDLGTYFPVKIAHFKDDVNVDYKVHEAIKFTAPHLFWFYLNEIAKNPQEDTFTVMLVEEYHTPCVGGWHSEKPLMMTRLRHYRYKDIPEKDMKRQSRETLKYLDKQLKTLLGIYPDLNAIIMADHGQMLDKDHIGGVFLPHLDNVHVPLMFHGNGKGTFKDLYGTVGLAHELKSFLSGESLEPEGCEEVVVQRDPIYDKKFKDNEEFVEGLGRKYLQGFKMYVREDGTLVEYEDGTKEEL